MPYCIVLDASSGHGSQVVKVTDSWPVCHELEPSTAEEPPCRGEVNVKPVEAQTSCRWCGVEVKRRDASSCSSVVFVT
ncbi:hypothetical protein TNCV_1784351 [Trichonephila clavipes]|nr:hypothetical protein TNCV_1784351 [Trichonephila clavipes]